ncbi:hypothetical protein DHW03_15290 [Pedobacter yonginense]|uniref:Methylamine utilisation protein MauE domain-containing protein n=1 Tax=Pedobacter yonginense TaxID=651869 RepID=A0A317EM91_9SPHI|nr:MauE/DoxX family redox-associated membrane protein [Pedobacter yonginense]PWS26158.1 hypothetical protein DHW03_15290 [Pedobacter yonginense]
MKTNVFTYLFASLLILLFVLTGVEKVVKFQEFKAQMSLQVFDKSILPVVTYFIPIAEIVCAGMLLFAKSRFAGFYLSALLMLAFMVYAALIVLHLFENHPCPCGGPIKHMNWRFHLVFNSIFLLFAVLGIIFTIKERRLEN